MTFIPKRSLNFQNFKIQYHGKLCVFAHFGANFSLQSTLQMRKCIVELCSGYLKNSSDSWEYVNKKIMVIRCVELNIKQGNDVLSQKETRVSKISRSNHIIANYVFLLILRQTFHFKVLYKCENASWSHVLCI